MVIGIDLGTTNSLCAYYKDGEAILIPNRLGKYLTPSVVAIDEEGIILVGEAAKEYGILHPFNVAKVFKRAMGSEKEYYLGLEKMRPEDLSGLVLRSLKEDAEAFLGCKVTDAIISVPAYFNEFQRKATKQAGEIAGLNVIRIINEPTAAALSYGLGKKDREERCLVFDLGGGTFDVSILEFYNNIVEVHSIAGDNFLGGEDFTLVLANMFLKKNAIAIETLEEKEVNRVLKVAENAKCEFVEKNEVTLSISLNGETLESTITISEYEEECKELLSRIRKILERSIRDANLKISEIDNIVLVGGATRLPIIRKFVVKLFGRFPGAVDPDTAIAVGAALQCGIKNREKEISEVVLTDVCPFTLGTEVNSFNGAFDESGHYLPIIERNTVIPVSRKETVYTSYDNQEKVRVKVLQGESRIASNNMYLGEIVVPVPKGKKGSESVDITFTYDVNSLLEVEVCVNSTGVTRKIIIQGGTNKLSDEEVKERMEKLAYLKQSPRENEQNKLILLRAERLYEESTGSIRQMIDSEIMRFERVLDSQDRAKIEKARNALNEFLNGIEE